MRPLLLMLLVAVAGAGSATPKVHRLVLGSTPNGIVFYYGHRLPSPYEVSVEFALAPDTTWRSACVGP
jgi:hypothetical protein